MQFQEHSGSPDISVTPALDFGYNICISVSASSVLFINVTIFWLVMIAHRCFVT